MVGVLFINANQSLTHGVIMKIRIRHQELGPAVYQILEHHLYKSIVPLSKRADTFINTFIVNNRAAIYLKYATKTSGPYAEYTFTFTRSHLDDLKALTAKHNRTFIVLVCVAAREICCLPADQLWTMLSRRSELLGYQPSSLSVYVCAPKHANFRAYVSPPGQKKHRIGWATIARNAFPGCLFGH
jgi:hypothetical protein